MRPKGGQPVILYNAPVIARERNDWYPLPADYPTLTADGQKQARCVACCQRSTPEAFVAAWEFFRSYYLEAAEGKTFYKRRLPSPPAHYQWIDDMARYGRNIHGAPRGSAKSTVIGTEAVLLLVLTRPDYCVLPVLSTYKLVKRRMGNLMMQLDGNRRILDDWGQMRPTKGGGRQWSITEALDLENGSTIEAVSVDGRKRGGRPDFILLDDPEFDPEHETQETELKGKLENLLFHQLLPMFDSSEQCFEWIGTIINAQSAIYAAAYGDDPRFSFFNRRIYSLFWDENDPADPSKTVRRYFWPEKWGPERIEELKVTLGEVAFEAEMQNNPISAQNRLFRLDPDYNFYTISGDQVIYTVAPDKTQVTRPLSEWLSGLGRLIVVDMRHNQTGIFTDYDGALVVGMDERQNWWILDLMLGRLTSDKLMAEVWRLGVLWKPQIVGIEAAAGQIHFKSWVESELRAKGSLIWEPRAVWPIKYPYAVSKEDRINALEPRVVRHQIRFPAHSQRSWPMSELMKQLALFTPDGRSLAHDDAIDMLAMVPYCPRLTAGAAALPEMSQDVWEQMASGNIYEPVMGLSIPMGIDISQVPSEVLQKFLDSRQRVEYNKRASTPSALQRRTQMRDRAVDAMRRGSNNPKSGLIESC